ncbi:Do family serine endopeptidase [Rhodobacteraceae bacterium NNCM2]|nr:Do family serine endopeptidase [Coraliihabitans acroporae]
MKKPGMLRTVRPALSVGAGALAIALMATSSNAAIRSSAGESLPEMVERLEPSVVMVISNRTVDAKGQGGLQQFGNDPNMRDFMKRFMPPELFGENQPKRGPEMATGLGSGFVISSDGYIVTNHHVIDGADRITVRMSDRKEYEAEVIGADAQTDLALLKIEATGLPALELADSGELRVGEDVIALGNPFGLGGSVTTGIVSGIARDIHAGPYVDFIQTDAAINRGNSGGPLFNEDGEVVGVNSAIYSTTGGSVGVGFAVPSNTVSDVVAELLEDGKVDRGWLGVAIQDVTYEIANAVGLDGPNGAIVADVIESGPSEDILKQGDIILSYDGELVDDSGELPMLVGATDADEKVVVEIWRDGKKESVTVTVGSLDDGKHAAADDAVDTAPEAEAFADLGFQVAPMDASLRGDDESANGAVVVDVDPSGAAARAGLRIGDVIRNVGSENVESPADVTKAIKSVEGDAVLLRVDRGGASLYLGIARA